MRSLIACDQCRRHVDAHAAVCPFCATPVVETPRRVSVRALTRAAIFASAAACGSTKPTSATPPPPPGDASVGDASVVDTSSDVAVADGSGAAPDAARHLGSLSGRVTYAGAAVAAGSMVTLVGVTDSHFGRQTATSATGAYAFADVPGGDYLMRAFDGNMRSIDLAVHIVDGIANTKNIDMPAEVRSIGPGAKPYGAPPARRRVV